jgi:hypothetical protein
MSETGTSLARRLRMEMVAPRSLLANPRNMRVHSRRQIKQIAESIKDHGFLSPLIADENRMVLAGNGRLQGAQLLGLECVPVVWATHLSAAQKRAFALADNKLTDNSTWNREQLAIELGELIELLPMEGIEISTTGFATAEIDLLLQDESAPLADAEDELPEIPQVPVTQRGDLWCLGENRLLCGDAHNLALLQRLMNGVSAKAVICDPPFNLSARAIGSRGRVKHPNFVQAAGEMQPEEFCQFLATTLSNAIQVSSDGALHYVFMDWRHVCDLISVGRSIYRDMLNLVVWDKKTGGQGSLYRSQHELIGVFRVGETAHVNNIQLGKFGRNRTNIWVHQGCNSFGHHRTGSLSAHPTVKPAALISEALLDCTQRAMRS